MESARQDVATQRVGSQDRADAGRLEVGVRDDGADPVGRQPRPGDREKQAEGDNDDTSPRPSVGTRPGPLRTGAAGYLANLRRGLAMMAVTSAAMLRVT